MAKNKDPYSRFKERFVEERAEDKGWEELTVGQRQKLANRFDVLAQTVEGRGRIVQTILPPDAPQERRRAVRQKIKSNLPSTKKSDNATTQSNLTTPQVFSPNSVPSVSQPWNAPSIRTTSGTTPRTTTTTTQSAANVNRSRQVTGEFGSTYKPSSFANWAAETKIPVYGDIFGAGIPVARVIRQGARELDEAYMAFKQGEITEGLKNVAGVGRELAFGAFDAAAVRATGYGALKLGSRLLGGRAASGAGRVVKALDKAALGGVGSEVVGGLRRKFSGGKTKTINETAPVASTSERVVASPQDRSATSTQVARTGGIKGQPPRNVPKPKGKTSTAKSEKTMPPVVAEPVAASPVKAPEVVAPAPIDVPGMTPPTPFQKVITPEAFTAPVATPTVATPATTPTNLRGTLVESAPKAGGKKGGKKGSGKKAEPKVTMTFTDEAPKVQTAEVTPAVGEVVGGATPKAKPSTSSPMPSLPSATESKKLTSESSTIPTSSVLLPESSPVVAPRKGSRKAKATSVPPVMPDKSPSPSATGTPESPATTPKKKGKKSIAELGTGGASEAHLKILREAPIDKIEYIINPKTGQPVINPKTGLPAQRIIYKSQAVEMAEAEAARKARRAEAPEAGVKMTFEETPAVATKTKATITFTDEGIPTTPEGKAKMEELRREATLNMVPNRGGAPEFPQTFVGQQEKQRRQMAVAEAEQLKPTELLDIREKRAKLAAGEKDVYVPAELRRSVRSRRRPPATTRQERAAVSSRAGTFNPKTGKPIERSLEELQALNAERLKAIEESRARPPQTPKADKPTKEQIKQQELLRESTARQRSPEAIEQSRIEETRRSVKSKQSVREQSLGRGSIIVDGERISVRLGRLRNEYRKAQRQARSRRYPKDVSQPMHTFSVNADDIKGLGNNPAYDDAFHRLSTADNPQTGASISDMLFNRPLVDQPPAPTGMERITFSERFNASQLSYEELLRIEQSGQYNLIPTYTPFSRRIAGGEFVKIPGQRGLSEGTVRGSGIEVNPAEMKRLVESTSGSFVHPGPPSKRKSKSK